MLEKNIILNPEKLIDPNAPGKSTPGLNPSDAAPQSTMGTGLMRDTSVPTGTGGKNAFAGVLWDYLGTLGGKG